ncbi:MAG TPA: ssDNA-binding protein [Verrucomicrobiae bacterium]|nr:ssDNA-binding protein [Verrucomicrobiae bacterium]
MPLSSFEVVTSVPVRLAFPNLYVPKAFKEGNRETYSATLLLPPDFNLAPITEAMKAACLERFGKPIAQAKLSDRGIPLRKCENQWEGYEEGWHFLRCASNSPPQVVDQKLEPIPELGSERRIFAGCWVRAHVTAWCWDHDVGGRGISFNLNSVQLIREDRRLGGGRPAAEVFEAVEVQDAPAQAGAKGGKDLLAEMFGE